MAEIRVEPKKQSSNTNWIWIVLVLLIAAAAVYYFMTRNNTDNDRVQPANTTGYIGLPISTPGNTAFM